MSDGGMGGNWIWAFLLFALLGNGGFGNAGGYRPQYATQQDVQMTSQFAQLLDGNRDIINNITAGTAQNVAAVNQAKYDNINVAKDIQMALSSQIGQVATMETSINDKIQQCCCETQRSIDGVNYNNAMNTAAINANTTAQTQKILDAISQNKIEALQGQINQLQLQNAMNGVVRYPNAWTYNAGTSPFCGCNNGCCGC
jgi:hypothetical protein